MSSFGLAPSFSRKIHSLLSFRGTWPYHHDLLHCYTATVFCNPSCCQFNTCYVIR